MKAISSNFEKQIVGIMRLINFKIHGNSKQLTQLPEIQLTTSTN